MRAVASSAGLDPDAYDVELLATAGVALLVTAEVALLATADVEAAPPGTAEASDTVRFGLPDQPDESDIVYGRITEHVSPTPTENVASIRGP